MIRFPVSDSDEPPGPGELRIDGVARNADSDYARFAMASDNLSI
jgi:hypothetical protein